MTVLLCTLPTELGEIAIAERGVALLAVDFDGRRGLEQRFAREGVEWRDGAASPARRQLAEYFAGARTRFDLELAPAGTPFQQRVWRALCAIPFGSTCSYGHIAARIGKPTASRAVGAANGRNPIAIVVPCHRVVGGDGTLTGYAGGLDKKRWLLALEARALGGERAEWPD
ncbi:MAG: methylated-DNA--[protein]-cysteine S-methyltransferase [Planctomycetota bacterium]